MASAPARRSALAALESPNYRLFFAGQLISDSGTLMQRIAQAWLVLDLTGSPVALGAVSAAQSLPIFLFALTAGVIVDRLPKRRFLTILTAVGLLQATAMAVLALTGRAEVWHIFGLAAVFGTGRAFEETARSSFLNEMVGRERLQSAVALNSMIKNFGRVAGPSLGGIIIATSGVGMCFAINALSYAVVLLMLTRMNAAQLHPAPAATPGSVRGQLIDGLRYVRGEPALLVPLVIFGFIGLFGMNFSTYVPLLARYAYETDALGFGWLNAAQGTGAIIGSVIVGSLARPRQRTLILAAGTFALVLLACGLAPTFALGLLGILLLGGTVVFFQASTSTVVQLTAREDYRGRVLSLILLLSAGTTPFGSTLTGWLAEHWGIRTAVMVDALLCLIGVAGGALLALRLRRVTTPAQPADV